MRNSFKLFLALFIVHCSLFIASAQEKRTDVEIYRNSVRTFSFVIKGKDVSADKIYFTVKKERVDSLDRLIYRRNLLAGGDAEQISALYTAPNTTVNVFVRRIDNWDLAPGIYQYDLISVDASDSNLVVPLYTGAFKIKENVLNTWDGTNLPDSGRTYFVLGEGNNDYDFAVYDASEGRWLPISVDSVITLLNIQAADVPDSVIYKSRIDKIDAKISHIVNVKEFGAVGDSITDNSVAFQNALDAAEGGTLVIPKGDYLNISPLYVSSNTKIIGYGATLIAPDTGWSLGCGGNYGSPINGCNYGMLNLIPFDPETQEVENVTVEGLAFWGTKETDIGHTPKFLYLNATDNIKILNCDFRNSKYEGIWCDIGAELNEEHNTNIQVSNCYFYDVGRDNEYYALPACQIAGQNIVISNNVLEYVGAGIAWTGGGASITGNFVKNCSGKGISAGDAYRDGGYAVMGNTVETTVDTTGTSCFYFLGSVYGYRNEPINVVGNTAILRGQPNVNGRQVPAIHVSNHVNNITFSSNLVQIDSFGIGFKIEVIDDSANVSFNNNVVVLQRDVGTSIAFQLYATTNEDTLYSKFSGNTILGFGDDDYAYILADANGGVNNYSFFGEYKNGGIMQFPSSFYQGGVYNNTRFTLSSGDYPVTVIGKFFSSDIITENITITNLPFGPSGLSGGGIYGNWEDGTIHFAIPKDLITNSGFNDWTGTGKLATPDGWVYSADPTRDTTVGYIEQLPEGKLHYVNISAPSGGFYSLRATGAESGVTYAYRFEVTDVNDTVFAYVGGTGMTLTEVGIYSGVTLATNNLFFQLLPMTTAGDITIDNVRFWKMVGGDLQAPNYRLFLERMVQDIGGTPTNGYTIKISNDTLYFAPDNNSGGLGGGREPDYVTIDTTAEGNLQIKPALVSDWNEKLDALSADPSPTLGGDLELSDRNIKNTTPTFSLTPTEMSYIDGTTGPVQSQLNLKINKSDTTGSGGNMATRYQLLTGLAGKQNVLTNPVTGTGTINQLAFFNSTGSTIGSLSTATYPSLTEVSYVKGVTSALQTQLNGKASSSHTHTEFADTIPIYFGMLDTVTTGEYVPIKIPNNYTVVEVSASCNSGTVTFNLEERNETTPYAAGTDVMTSDLVADTDQQETTTFSNSSLAKNNRLCLVVTSKTGDPTAFEVSVFCIKTN